MTPALIIGGLAIVLVVLTPALRALHPGSKVSDDEYFAAARKRAISYRRSKPAAAESDTQTVGNE